MLDYVISKPVLLESIREEVSMVADQAYSDDGTPLYDSIVVTEKDTRTLERFIDDAVSQFVKREFDVTKYVQDGLEFNVPDFDTSMEDAFKDELSKYIVMFSCCALFQQRRATLVPEYTNRAQTSMDKAVALLKSRKHPLAQW